MRSLLMRDEYDWEGDQHLHVPLTEAVIYELHVGGFSRHPSADTQHPGTFRAVIEKIPYLKSSASPTSSCCRSWPSTCRTCRRRPRRWAWRTSGATAPTASSRRIRTMPATRRRARDEFRDMVKALHRAGIGVILDVVYNHTAEGGADGPIISFKGIGNEVFYHLDFDDRSRYRDYTGCGNTVNCNHPMVTRFLIDCLHYWAHDMHVDGFRFDLASAMARGEDGKPQYHAPVLWSIELSPELGRAHIIAEAWDAAGLYQVGDFPGFRWAEWNGHYRDVMRAFVRGDPGLIGDVATRIAGSSDLYQAARPAAGQLHQLRHLPRRLHPVRPGQLRRQAQRGQRRGQPRRPQPQPELELRRRGPHRRPGDPGPAPRQARNFMAMLLLSQGVPMLLAGDELLRTKQGNNNTYCQTTSCPGSTGAWPTTTATCWTSPAP
jgi:isoamylase